MYFGNIPMFFGRDLTVYLGHVILYQYLCKIISQNIGGGEIL